MNHDRAAEYAYNTLNGAIISCETVKQASKRFLNDLDRQDTEDFPYHYNAEYAENVCKFIELLPTDNREKLKLLPFQSFLICNLFGWRTQDNGMRFKTLLYSCARKSGKSFLVASISLVYLCLERGFSKQVLFTAGSLQQAHLAFDKAKNQLRNMQQVSPAICERFKITSEKILDKDTDSFAVPLATNGNTGRLDGYGADFAVMDECGNIPNKVFTDTKQALETGMIQNPNAVLCMISTAGTSVNSFKSECEYAKKILSGKVENERYLALIYSLDGEEEFLDKKLWVKANPIIADAEIGGTMLEKIENDVQTATQQGDLSNVLVKNFNIWKQVTENPFIEMSEWKKAETSKMDIRGKDCYIGIDLSVRNDLTAISWIVPLDNGEWYADSFSFIGTSKGIERKERTDEFNYRQAAKRGECELSTLESGIIDYDRVFDWLMNFIEDNRLNVLGIGYDPYNSNSLVAKLDKSPLPLIAVRQGPLTLNVPTRGFHDMLLSGKIHHAKNKLLDYAAANATVKIINNNWLLQKTSKMSGKHIDPMAALIDSYVIGMDYFDKQENNEEMDNYYSKDFSF